MRAARTTSYGPPDLLRVEEVDDPRPGAGEVVVDIAAAAVNYPDLLIMSGGYQVSWPLPLVPGSEFAGTVRAVDTGVTGPRIVDRVAGTTAVGAFAEQIAVAADALWPVPDGADLTEAAALRVTYLTAYHARCAASPRRGPATGSSCSARPAGSGWPRWTSPSCSARG
jgi:NADPH2:quinone reductase